MLLLIEKTTDTLIERMRTKPQKARENKLKSQRDTFSFSAINFAETKWFIAVTSFEAIKSIFSETDDDNSFSNSTLEY